MQLSKAILIYADDYNETPPFVATAQADWDDTTPTGPMDRPGIRLEYDWFMDEDWLYPDQPEQWMAFNGQAGADDEDVVRLMRQGTLWNYARFERLYRCPEFERMPAPNGGQRVFNYTRTWLGRRIGWGILGDRSDYTGEPLPEKFDGEGIEAGKIVKLSQAYAPSAYWMMIDEQYNRHVGAGPLEFNPPLQPGGLIGQISGMPMCADSVHTIIGDEVGRYHGPKGRAVRTAQSQALIPETKQGSISYYDGHVGLFRDPLPDRHIEGGSFEDILAEIEIVVNMLGEQLYGQRGVAIPTIDLSSL